MAQNLKIFKAEQIHLSAWCFQIFEMKYKLQTEHPRSSENFKIDKCGRKHTAPFSTDVKINVNDNEYIISS